MSWLLFYCSATCLASLLSLIGASAEGYNSRITSGTSCAPQPTTTITSGVATSTVTVNTTFVTFTVYEDIISATHKPYLGRGYSENLPTYNSTAPPASPYQTSTLTPTSNATSTDECSSFTTTFTTSVPASISIISTSQLIATTITLRSVPGGPVFPGNSAATSTQNSAQEQIQPGTPQQSAPRNQPSVQQTSSPGNGKLGQSLSPQPGRGQAFGQAGAVQPSPTSPNPNGSNNDQPITTPIGAIGDEPQPDSGESPTNVASSEEEGVSASGAFATDESVPPGEVSDDTEPASSQEVQFTGNAYRNLELTRNCILIILASIYLL